MALAGGSLLAGCGGSSGGGSHSVAPSTTSTPVDVLQFALNLEYLEAAYYQLGTNGAQQYGSVSGDNLPTNSKVTFSKYGHLFNDIMTDETNHVAFLQSAITAAGVTPISRPAIDLVKSFNTAAGAAGLPTPFNPFLNETYFLLGAFIFEDVGVTAYHGGANYLTVNDYLIPAAGILAVEAYHAGAIRYALSEAGLTSDVQAICKARAAADGSGGTGHEDPIDGTGQIAIAATGAGSVAFERTVQQVLNVVYLNVTPAAGDIKGGFFPKGLNGFFS
jgi:hypothetical protein